MKPCEFSPCGKHRYKLYREVQPEGLLAAFIGINPSTANDTEDDPTMRKIKGFCLRNGFRGFIMSNVFSFISPHVKDLKDNPEVLNWENLWKMKEVFSEADVLVPCWGSTVKFPKQDSKDYVEYLFCVSKNIVDSSKPVKCLGLNKDGSPRHPLMLPYNTPLEDF